MFSKRRAASLLAAMTLTLAGQVQASLLLDVSVTNLFNGNDTTTNTYGNDLPNPRPSTLYFGQLKATANGVVDFFYVGNEAAYTNTLNYGNGNTHSTAGRPDVFTSPHALIGSLQVVANTFLDFGFSTSGGNNVGGYGKSLANDDAGSLVAQYNHNGGRGHRSIGFSALSAYDPNNGNRVFSGNPGTSDVWGIFWDDSGAKNDDNHDDYITVARFRPVVSVPEPGTLAVFVIGLMGAALALRTGVARQERTKR